MSSDVADLIERARELMLERAGSEGTAHLLGVAEACERLARVYGVDSANALLAGLLHDWAKGLSDEQLLAEARARGFAITDVDECVPYLLHGPVGAALIAEELPEVPAEVLCAVARHTLGATDMSELDMLTFVADMIEDGRDFEGVDVLRTMVGDAPLRELYLAAYASSMTHVVSVRHHLHPATVPAWNAALDAVREAAR